MEISPDAIAKYSNFTGGGFNQEAADQSAWQGQNMIGRDYRFSIYGDSFLTALSI